jgi:hypothetical protein
MISNPVLRTVVTAGYGAVRAPLALADRRLPRTSAVHPVIERGLRGLDGLMSGILAGPADARAAEQTAATGTESTAPDAERIAQEWEQVAAAVRAEQADVGELADPNLDVADVQAELRAKHIVEERLEQRTPRSRG